MGKVILLSVILYANFKVVMVMPTISLTTILKYG
jgi:hypothetical protein